MATYALYTASLGSQFANDTVKIFDVATMNPAIIMGSATGGVINTLGLASLDGSGNLSVYLDTSKTWAVNPYPTGSVTASSSNTQESTQLLVKAAVQTIATNTAGGGGGATSALQTTGNTTLSTIATNTTGAATSVKQDTGNTSLATIATNTTGGATSVKQDTGNTSLGIIAANVGTVTPVDHSSSITTGGTAKQLMAANSIRRGFWFQNQSTGDLWINDLGTAVIFAGGTPQSMKIASGVYYESPTSGAPSGAISVIGATTGQAYACREW